MGAGLNLEKIMPSIFAEFCKPGLYGGNLAAPNPGWWLPMTSGHLCTN